MKGRWTAVFAGGGTGGHLYPGLAVAEEIKALRPDTVIAFVGTKGKIEARVVPQKGYRFLPIWISGFTRTLSFSLALFPFKVIISLIQSLVLLLREKPAVVMGTGGYVSGPPVFMASLLGIPTLLQEQNSYPGVTTRLLADRVDEVHLTFEATRRFIRRTDRVFITGNPVRSMVGRVGRAESAAAFGLDPGKTTVLVFGGSLGAASINAAISRNATALAAMHVQMIVQTGTAGLAEVQQAMEQHQHEEKIIVMPFIEKMEYALGASDLAVCRAGATTLAELALAGLPSILVPYPFAAADHQTENARAVMEAGAAVMCPDADLGARLVPAMADLLAHPERLSAMRTQARRLATPDAAVTIARAVLRLAGDPA